MGIGIRESLYVWSQSDLDLSTANYWRIVRGEGALLIVYKTNLKRDSISYKKTLSYEINFSIDVPIDHSHMKYEYLFLQWWIDSTQFSFYFPFWVEDETVVNDKCRESEFVSRQGPYHVERTGSRPIIEVKQHWARLVLGWVTAWESRVPLAFLFANSHPIPSSRVAFCCVLNSLSFLFKGSVSVSVSFSLLKLHFLWSTIVNFCGAPALGKVEWFDSQILIIKKNL
jgi:hypothetical protein